nr:hypothetical protein CFP56_37304 [Quercus suber]
MITLPTVALRMMDILPDLFRCPDLPILFWEASFTSSSLSPYHVGSGPTDLGAIPGRLASLDCRLADHSRWSRRRPIWPHR